MDGADAPSKPVRTRPRRYPIQAFALAGAAVTALVMGIGNSAGGWSMAVLGIVMTAVAILVAGTLLGIIINRSWFGVPMLALPSIVGAALLISAPNLNGGFGDRTIRPSTIADLTTQQQGAGRLIIDLTAIVDGAQPIRLDAELGIGGLRVIVPTDAELVLSTTVNAGHVVIDGREVSAGMRQSDERRIKPTTASGTHRVIVLDLRVGAGEIRIDREG